MCTMHTIILLPYTYSCVWTQCLDILLNTEACGKGPNPVVCHGSNSVRHQLNVTNWLISAGEQFAASKTVRSVDGDMVVLASLSPCQRPFSPSTNRNDISVCLCSAVCTTILSGHSVYVQAVFNVTSTKQSYFDALVRPDTMEDVMRAIISILNHVKWRTVAVITSSYDVLTALSGGRLAQIKSLMYIIDDPSNPLGSVDLASIYQLLLEEDLNLLVVCPSDCVQKLLSQARLLESNMAKTNATWGSKWLVIPLAGSVMDIAHSREPFKTDAVVFLEFMPCSRYYAPLNLENTAQQRSNMTEPEVEQMPKSTMVQAKLQVLSKSHTGTKVETVGNIQGDGSMEVKHQLYHERAYGFHNRMLTVGTLEWAPFVIKRVENGSVRFDGLCIQLLQELARQLNFSYRLMEPKDKESGRILNGSWTGLVKLLRNEEVDMIVAPMTITESRATVIDFTVPYFYTKSALILSKQDPHKWLTLLYLFHYEVLVCILVTLIFSTVFLFVIEEVTPVRPRTNKKHMDLLTQYGDILWYHFGALMANGGAYLPNTESGRMVLICWWLFAVIMAATYSGNLIAFLTAGREKPPFSSLAEMVQQDTYNWGFVGGASVSSLFQVSMSEMIGFIANLIEDSNISVYQKIWQRVEETAAQDPDWLSPDGNEHLRRAAESQYVYISEESTLEMWDDPRRCNVQMLNENFRSMQLAVGLPPNSGLVHVFSQLILRLIESGLLDLWWNRLKPKHQCESPSRSTKRVDLPALQSAFYAAGVGVAMALLVLVIEMCNKRRCKQGQKRNPESIEKDSLRSDASTQGLPHVDIPSST